MRRAFVNGGGNSGGLIVRHPVGPLPGVIVFEPGGQMAESWVCRENQRFLRLPVTDAQLDRTKAYFEHVRTNRRDRKPKTAAWSIIPQATKLRENAKRLLFYAGQNNFRTGMMPRCLPNAKLHSPFFSDTVNGLAHLSSLDDAKDWIILFKPHPNIRQTDEPALNHVETVAKASVFECIHGSDVTVTVVSTTAYQALIHEKPALLLGRMNLSWKMRIRSAIHGRNPPKS
jgi:hypothetical protein